MPKLVVSNFSCIERAEIDLARLTVIVGPQSSGKSLLSKLIYFFGGIISAPFSIARESFEEFCEGVELRFQKWFPSSAWGAKKFSITYVVGEVVFEIAGRRTRVGATAKATFSASPNFKFRYDAFQVATKDVYERFTKAQQDKKMTEYTLFNDLRYEEHYQFIESLGDDAIDNQLYIPAGRTFFLSLSKAFAATRESEELDPITRDFGRYFGFVISSIERGGVEGALRQFPPASDKIAQKLLGGKIEFINNSIMIVSSDGRTIPTVALSSGQQELLPLYMMLSYWGMSGDTLQFIEEPEAHLFPASQSALTELLVQKLNGTRSPQKTLPTRRMVITTHSPYILSKINNLLKAGSLYAGGNRMIRKKVTDLIRRDTMLLPGSTTAVGIQDGRTIDLIGDGILIDSAYLDSISNTIVEEFSNLQDIELELE